jgi:hypothetical protein
MWSTLRNSQSETELCVHGSEQEAEHNLLFTQFKILKIFIFENEYSLNNTFLHKITGVSETRTASTFMSDEYAQ